MLRLPAMEPLPDEVEPQRLRDLMCRQIGSVQFPDLILDIDAPGRTGGVRIAHAQWQQTPSFVVQ